MEEAARRRERKPCCGIILFGVILGDEIESRTPGLKTYSSCGRGGERRLIRISPRILQPFAYRFPNRNQSPRVCLHRARSRSRHLPIDLV